MEFERYKNYKVNELHIDEIFLKNIAHIQTILYLIEPKFKEEHEDHIKFNQIKNEIEVYFSEISLVNYHHDFRNFEDIIEEIVDLYFRDYKNPENESSKIRANFRDKISPMLLTSKPSGKCMIVTIYNIVNTEVFYMTLSDFASLNQTMDEKIALLGEATFYEFKQVT